MKLPKEPNLKKICDKLWSDIIKERAEYKSEISDLPGNVAHHIVAKPNLRLRYDLDNGICLSNATEHIFGAHHKFDTVRARKFQDLIINKIGRERYNKLLSLRKGSSKVDLKLIKIFLEQELNKLRGGE